MSKPVHIDNGTFEPKYAIIDAAATDNTLVSAVTGKKIRVYALYVVASALANTLRFESGTGGTALSGQMVLVVSEALILPFNPLGWFETAKSALLNLELSGATSVDGGLVYAEVD